MGVRIRRTDDLQAVHELDRRIFHGDKPSLDQGEAIAHEWWIAEAGDDPVGFIGLRIGSAGASIERVGVLPEARGGGLQKRLCRVAMRYARRNGIRRVFTYVMASNIPSLRSLLAVGLKPHGSWLEGKNTFIKLETTPTGPG